MDCLKAWFGRVGLGRARFGAIDEKQAVLLRLTVGQTRTIWISGLCEIHPIDVDLAGYALADEPADDRAQHIGVELTFRNRGIPRERRQDD